MNPLSVLLVVTLGGLLSPLVAVLADGTAAATVGTPFSLALSQSARLEGTGLSVRFDEVTADSRCPAEVACVWAGVASVVLELAREDLPIAELTLDTLSKTAEAEGLRFSLVKLDPPPSVHAPSPQYVGTFLVEPAP